MAPLPLTRAVNLCDFDGVCASPAAWQQQHAHDATERWRALGVRIPSAATVACYNWGAAPFTAPIARPPCEYFDAQHTIDRAPDRHAIIYAFSVLDRIDSPTRALRSWQSTLILGGLLVTTFALWDAMGEDVALGHACRTRIYDRLRWKRLIDETRWLGFRTFGGVDLRYPGDTLGDHSLAALVLTKERS